MKFAVHITVLLVAIATLSVGALVYKFAPRAQTPQGHSTFNTQWQQNDIFAKPNPTHNSTKKYTLASSTKDRAKKDSYSFLNSWQDIVEQATSSQIVNIVATTSTTTYSEEEQALNLGNILRRVNTQLQSIGQSSVTDDDINNLVYRKSTVDLGGSIEAPIFVSTVDTTELRQYGNALAIELTAFRLTQADQLTVLDTFFKNSNDSSAKEALRRLARAYKNLSADVGSLNAPSEVVKINQDISDTLAVMSTKLLELAELQTDTEIYKKALEYNKKSEDLAKNTLKLIDTFLFNDVRFKSSEPGSIFMFK